MPERADDATTGGAIPLVLVVVLALTALGHAAFLVSLEDEAASRASVAVLQARVMAEASVRRALRDAAADTLPEVLSTGLRLDEGGPSGARFQVDLRRLSRELYWVEGTGFAALAPGGPERVRDRTARLLWALSPLQRISEVVAAVEHGGGTQAPSGAIGILDAGERRPFAAPVGCLDRGAALDSAGVLLAATARTLPAAPGLPALGLVGHDSLLARVEARTGGSVTPGPVVEEGRCVTAAPRNWGSPGAPEGGCGGHRPAVAAEGDLTLVGGEGQGLLVVTGDLRLTAGARYAGLVLVAGDLVLDGGAVLEGLARVRGQVRVEGGARIRGMYCPALLALEAGAALRRPLLLPGGGWIRPL
jgi:hypothetical protein